MFYIYVLKSRKDGKLYIGYTDNLVSRIKLHNSGKVASTKDRIPFIPVYFEAYKNRKDARRREIQLKKIGSQRAALKKRIKESLE